MEKFLVRAQVPSGWLSVLFVGGCYLSTQLFLNGGAETYLVVLLDVPFRLVTDLICIGLLLTMYNRDKVIHRYITNNNISLISFVYYCLINLLRSRRGSMV